MTRTDDEPTHAECARGHWLAPANSGLPPIVCPFCLDDALRWRSVADCLGYKVIAWPIETETNDE